mgnify:CR=1 FL=1
MKTHTRAPKGLQLLVGGLALAMGVLAGAADWQHISEQDNEALPGNQIQFIEVGAGGVVWIGGLKGLTRYEKGEFTAVKEVVKKRKETIKRAFGLQSWGVLGLGNDQWLVGHNRGVSLIEGTMVKRHELLGGYNAAPVVQGRDGVIWTLGKVERNKQQITDIFQRGKDGQWTLIEFFKKDKESGKKMIVEDLFLDSRGDFWVTISGNGVIKADPSKKPEQWEHMLKGYNVTTLGEDPKGHIWCGLWERGVTMLHEGASQRHLPHEDTVPLAIDGSGEDMVWVATNDRGLFQKVGKEWQHHFAEEGAINLLEVTSDGRVWVSSQKTGGLKYWSGEEWKTALPGPFPIRTVTVTEDGAVWAGGILDGLHIKKK